MSVPYYTTSLFYNYEEVTKLLNVFFITFSFRGLAVGIYATNSSDTCKYILSNCKANVVVVEDDKQLQKILLVKCLKISNI